MANIAYVIINSGFGNVGEAPPNAVVEADVIVKNPQNQVVYSQPFGCDATLDYGDTYGSFAAKMTASIRNTLNDQTIQVVFL